MSLVPQNTAGLIFDCDGTLVDSLPMYREGWITALEDSLRQNVPLEWFHGHGGMSEHMVLDIIEEKLGRGVDREGIINQARTGMLQQLHVLREITVVADIARQYHGRLPMAVASNGSRQIVSACLRHLGLERLFDAIITIDDVQNPKPAPDMFLLAAGRLTLEPHACLVFEDSREGMMAATRAGMKHIDVNTLLG
ncbi:HAD family phosphatase [Komagataeibacter medellinensis]|uniref:HAD family phosphatase n=1 Tax=Komagataeibacter medellinensis TaxID=1177712 RepID=A0ABQ6VWA1_9PROT|nr:HAD family phosphatase [Komagataeibacter medellinensis]KAB8123343.1 HAD family phosphatase [Komagataeibacter medellinensis]